MLFSDLPEIEKEKSVKIMKKATLAILISSFFMACTTDESQPATPEIGISEEISSIDDVASESRLQIPDGFAFESTTSSMSNIQLDGSFTDENVKIRLFHQGREAARQLIFDGFINKENALKTTFKIPNHIEYILILASFNGVEVELIRAKTDITATFGFGDFINTERFAKIATSRNDYTFCEHGGSNGTVEIYNRVLVIKGSVFDDELDMDKDNGNTKVILKTNGTTRVDTQYDNADFDCIFVYLGNGKDKVQMGSTQKPSLINLGNGTDEITASDGAKDIIYGGNGKDKIIGKFASDELIGGNGNDDIDNGSGGNVTEGGSAESCEPSCYSPSTDADGDGYASIESGGIDVDDSNPNVVSRNYPQGMDGFYSVIFEDLWPCQGDYDFNDLIMNYNFSEGLNGDNMITEFDFGFKVPALGGAYNNYAVLRVYDPDDNAVMVRNDGQNIVGNRVHDAVNQSTLFYFENLKSFYTANESAIINTREKTYPTVLEMEGTVAGVDGAYDVFILKDGDVTMEIHPNVTDGISGASSFLSTSVGGCHEGEVVDFKTDEGFPWGMVVPIEWEWPKEGVDILEAYPDFRTFVESDPSLDWYSNENPSRNLDKIIQ